MTVRVLVVGFDALQEDLALRWAEEGHLPNLARLHAGASSGLQRGTQETIPFAVWPEVNTGQSCARTGLCGWAKVHSGEAQARLPTDRDFDPAMYYWSVARRAGRRVAAVDMRHALLAPDPEGPELIEWGDHDPMAQPSSQPAAWAREVIERYGHYPAKHSSRYTDSWADLRRLRDDLVEGARVKARLLTDLVTEGAWDLVTTVFGEVHTAGHRFWHLGRPEHPIHDPDTPADLRSALLDVYRASDEALGRLLEAAGPESRVIVHSAHGISDIVLSPHLMSAFAVRVGLDRSRHGRGWWAVPPAPQRLLKGLVPRPLQHRFSKRLFRPNPGSRGSALRNGQCGALRLNLAGREPHGVVAPGAEAEALLEELRRELLALRLPGGGPPIVARVQTAEEAFGPDPHPNTPDLLVLFRDDLGTLDACESERVGRIDTPVYRNGSLPRSSLHGPPGRIWLRGPGIPGGLALPDSNVLDVAPTALRFLGVAVPEVYDGRPLQDLLAKATRAA